MFAPQPVATQTTNYCSGARRPPGVSLSDIEYHSDLLHFVGVAVACVNCSTPKSVQMDLDTKIIRLKELIRKREEIDSELAIIFNLATPTRRLLRCSRCGEEGHNAKTCLIPIAPVRGDSIA
jgi:hypothetical protein